jgi:hypothetical protein
MALMEACLTVLRGREGEPDAAAAVYRPPIPNLFRVPDALVRMRAKLAEITGAEPLEAFLPRMPQTTTNRELLARSAVTSTFMAALELARGAELALGQNAAFQGIVVTPLGAPAPEPAAAQAHCRHKHADGGTRAGADRRGRAGTGSDVRGDHRASGGGDIGSPGSEKRLGSEALRSFSVCPSSRLCLELPFGRLRLGHGQGGRRVPQVPYGASMAASWRAVASVGLVPQ